jgi:hypothetical protein
VKSGLQINTPNGVQHMTFELCSCADAKFLALLLRQLANSNTCFSLVSPNITALSKTDPHLVIGEAAGDAKPYTYRRRCELFMALAGSLDAKRQALITQGVDPTTIDWHAQAVAILRGVCALSGACATASRCLTADVCMLTEQGHAQIGLPRDFGLVLVDVLHLLFNCVKAGLRRYLRLLAWLSAEFKEPMAYFEAFTHVILALSSSLFSQLAQRVAEKREKASLSLDGGAATVLLREHPRWLASTYKLQQRDHTRQLHVVLLHLFRRMQHILQIACSVTVCGCR